MKDLGLDKQFLGVAIEKMAGTKGITQVTLNKKYTLASHFVGRANNLSSKLSRSITATVLTDCNLPKMGERLFRYRSI